MAKWYLGIIGTDTIAVGEYGSKRDAERAAKEQNEHFAELTTARLEPINQDEYDRRAAVAQEG